MNMMVKSQIAVFLILFFMLITTAWASGYGDLAFAIFLFAVIETVIYIALISYVLIATQLY